MNETAPTTRLVVSIDTLALNGFTHFDGHRFGAALQRELGFLISQRPPAPGAWRVETVQLNLSQAGSSPAGFDSDGIGVQVARAIYAQMQGEGV